MSDAPKYPLKGSGTSGRRWLRCAVWTLIVVALLLAAYGIWSRHTAVTALQKRADDASLPRVQVINPQSSAKRTEFTLPGALHAWYEAPLYAQVSGYVTMWYKDYGAIVKKGDLLATIDSPTLDAEYEAAQAAQDAAEAQYKLAAITAKRWQSLKDTKAVSQQDIDVRTANAAVAKSQLAQAKKNTARYAARESFKRILAPYAGVVTARLTDVGFYVSAMGGDAGAHSGAQLFTVADVHQMRIFVSVPQNYSDILKPGLTATFSLPQRPGKVYSAAFMTSANAVATQTRTITTELTIDNPNHDLWPGSYVSVNFSVPGDGNVFVLPQQALIFRAQGLQVALVNDQDKVHLQNVKLGLNLGNKVQITEGLNKDDRVISSPSAALLEGQQVKIVQPVAGYGAASQSASTQTQTTGTTSVTKSSRKS